MKQIGKRLEKQFNKPIGIDYLIYLPEKYNEKRKKKWPIILFLHGSEERGNSIEKVLSAGLPKILERNNDLPFIVISPQCPENMTWDFLFDELNCLLKEIEEKYKVDEKRVYLTGLSMGADGVWHFAVLYPEKFTALVPICGGPSPFFGFPGRVKVLKEIPIWVFHGAKDRIVRVREAEKLVNILKKAGSDVKFTIFQNQGHDAWTKAYEDPELYKWLLKHKRK